MTRAEIAKVARLLRVEEEELSALAAAPEEDVRRLREQVTDRLFDGEGRRLQRIAEAARVLPVPLVAKLGRRVFGPLLCARLAGLLDPARAVDIATRWPDEFAAAVAAEMDPRRASAVVAAMPTERVISIAGIFAREGEYVAMGRFVGQLDPGALRACVAAIDEESILRTALVLEGARRIDELVAGMADERLAALAEVAAAEGLEEELGHLRAGLSKAQRARLDKAA